MIPQGRIRDVLILAVLVGVVFVGCSQTNVEEAAPRPSPNIFASSPSPEVDERAELDAIFMMLTYAVVLKDWQSGADWDRGHNIGSVLADTDGRPVFWARNANKVTGNSTQHAELRAMMGYLSQPERVDLDGFTLYSSLESCVMCAGMATFQNVERVVHGQTSPGLGGVFDRLNHDGSDNGGLPPYPRQVEALQSPDKYSEMIDDAFRDETGSSMAFLRSDEVRAIMEQAAQDLRNYQPRYAANRPRLAAALVFLEEQVTDDHRELDVDL